MDFSINNQSAEKQGIYLVDYPDILTAEQNTTFYSVSGRDGSMAQDEGLQDVNYTFKFAIYNFSDVYQAYSKAISFLKSGNYVSTDEWNFNLYFNHIQIGNATVDKGVILNFSVVYRCRPLKYLKNIQPITLTTSGTVNNIGTYKALPSIRVYRSGAGTGTLKVNSDTITFDMQKDFYDVDSYLMDCFSQNTNMNAYMSGVFPELKVGSNTISFTGTISKIQIEPRWVYL
ncbi:hypothetical protein QS460_04295 [Liquorilactobacillus mali]|uniref:Uncharacterized protein n=1 Tax=Liquorilactobacillus mali TaxID=1618 RepID=A0A0R2FW35_9LACO|nr:hypothetical protein [Liquorilactobacillus mali]KRN31638.1 hypothetical protein IV36_GL001762 [Liquorilactobacillus mali]MDN7145145.1 hypothetical protein [Liquorilactobacillus mali]